MRSDIYYVTPAVRPQAIYRCATASGSRSHGRCSRLQRRKSADNHTYIILSHYYYCMTIWTGLLRIKLCASAVSALNEMSVKIWRTFPINGTRWCSHMENISMSRTITISSWSSWNTALFRTSTAATLVQSITQGRRQGGRWRCQNTPSSAEV